MSESKINLEPARKDSPPVDFVYNYAAKDVVTNLRDQVWKQTMDGVDDSYLASVIGEIFSTTGLFLESIDDNSPTIKDIYTDDNRLLMMFLLGSLTQQANIYTPLIDGLNHIEAQKIRRSAGGKETAKKRKENAENLAKKIIEKWNKSNALERDRASQIATQLGVTAKTVRYHLKKANIR